VCTGKAFSLVRFFDAYQRNELARSAGETLLTFVSFVVPGRKPKVKINGEVGSFRLRRLHSF
jgi:hypothetical protein